MKLELTRVVQGRSRLGVLKGLGKKGEHSLEVPGCLLYTHLGTVPHLTQDTLHTLSQLPCVTQVTLSNMWAKSAHTDANTEVFVKSDLHLYRFSPQEQSTGKCWRSLKMDSGRSQVHV